MQIFINKLSELYPNDMIVLAVLSNAVRYADDFEITYKDYKTVIKIYEATK